MPSADALLIALIGAALALAAFAAKRDLRAPLAFAAPLLVCACAGAAGVAAMLGYDWRIVGAFAALLLICALIVEIDRRALLIPDPLTAGLGLLALALPFVTDWREALWGAGLLGALFLAVRSGFSLVRGGEGLGLGDVKLATAIGALLGPYHGLMAVAVAGLATLGVVTVSGLRAGAVPRTPAPFGIGLAAGLATLAALRLGAAS
jgi:leader peptidase (prepilin peptidase) / N-methyltransferase